MRIKPPEFEALFSLPLWAEIVMPLRRGESQSAALGRLKRRTMKYAKEGRFYRLRIEHAGIRVQRVPEGGQRKLGDWTLMPVGTRLLLKTTPNARDIRSAKATAVHLSDTWENGRGRGSWLAGLDENGRLVAERYYDGDGNGVDQRLNSKAPVVELWAGEWA